MENTDKRMKNLRPQNTRTPEERRKVAAMGGKASAKKRKERKTIADALRQVLDEPTEKGGKMTRLEEISVRVVKNLYDRADVRDLKALAEILGEMEQKVVTDGTIKIEELPKGFTKEQAKDFIASMNK